MGGKMQNVNCNMKNAKSNIQNAKRNMQNANMKDANAKCKMKIIVIICINLKSSLEYVKSCTVGG